MERLSTHEPLGGEVMGTGREEEELSYPGGHLYDTEEAF